MLDAYEVDSDAQLVDITTETITLDTSKVIVVIDHDNKTVYLWRGKKASLFKKLMGTRVAAKLSHEYKHYRIRPVAEDQEPSAFLDLVDDDRH